MLTRLLIPTLALAHPWSQTAEAHPESATVGLKLRISVEAEALVLTLIAEVPIARLALTANQPGYPQNWLDDLQTGLLARWNDQRLPLTPLTLEKPVRESPEPGMGELEVQLSAPLALGAGTLVVDNGVLPTESCLLAVAVELDGSWRVQETSLFELHQGKIRNNQNGAWRRSEDARRTTLVLQPASWQEHTTGMASLEARIAGQDGGRTLQIIATLATILGFAWFLFRPKPA